MNQSALIAFDNETRPLIGRVLLLFEHTQNNLSKTLALVHIFQKAQVFSGGISHHNTKERYNNLEINQSSTLELIEISDFMTTVASIVSKLNFPEFSDVSDFACYKYISDIKRQVGLVQSSTKSIELSVISSYYVFNTEIKSSAGNIQNL
ncbi:hypothetical protein BD770DRAFT_416337 [Pilaira anomala]|nr:hypothetical protein BD770DRAFT_416337 [Pilaira anomala]